MRTESTCKWRLSACGCVRSTLDGALKTHKIHDMWDIPEFKQLPYLALRVSFHSCCHGGTRKKLTGIMTNFEQLRGLEAFCNGDHEHEAWGFIRTEDKWPFATPKEAAYPRLLCERFATLLQIKCQQEGMHPVPSISAQSATAKQRASKGKQPSVSKVPPIISEFQFVQTIHSKLTPCLDAKSCLTKAFQGVPLGSCLIHAKGGSSDQTASSGVEHNLQEYKFGVYRSAAEFVKQAKDLMHPFDTCHSMPELMVGGLNFVLTSGPVVVMKHRLQTLAL